MAVQWSLVRVTTLLILYCVQHTQAAIDAVGICKYLLCFVLSQNILFIKYYTIGLLMKSVLLPVGISARVTAVA